nr:hypothetical protein MFLOJ_11200 [Mycobacterium florentinum]
MSPSGETLRNRNLGAPAVVAPQTKTQLFIGKSGRRGPPGDAAHTVELANHRWPEQYEGTSEQYPALGET